jgi:metallo-beta-lactamase class B
MKSIIFFICFFSIVIYPQFPGNKIIISDNLELIQLTENSYIHISFTDSELYGRFSSNGLIYFNNNEAVILDTPPDENLTKQLINWLYKTFPEVKIKAVVVNHFHNDCLGGLNVFHKIGVKSYSYKTTPELAEKINMPVPENTFSGSLKIPVGNKEIICKYFGEAHTKDNIVVWIPDEKILFGGCMVKSMSSGKGNLSDANASEWANTVEKVKEEFISAKYVIPGHGSFGGTELLDYTIKLFRSDR